MVHDAVRLGGRPKERALTRSLRDLTPVREMGQGKSGASSGVGCRFSHKPSSHLPSPDGKAAPKIVLPRPRIPCWKMLWGGGEDIAFHRR